MLSYDFSKWSPEGADDTIRDDDVVPSDGEPLPVSFRVYTPKEIKEKPLVKTAPPPPVDSGFSNVSDVVEVAKSFGTRGLVMRIALGGLGALIAVGLIGGLASLADDTPAHATAATAPPTPTLTYVAPVATAPPTPAAAVAPIVTPVVTRVETAPPAEDAIELPDRPGRPRPRAAGRTRPSILTPPSNANGKHIIRDNPY